MEQLDENLNAKVVKRLHPRKPKRNRKILKVDYFLFDNASTPAELFQSLETTKVKALEVKSMISTVQKKLQEIKDSNKYLGNHQNQDVDINTLGTLDDSKKLDQTTPQKISQDENTKSVNKTKERVEDNILRRQERCKHLWQYIIFLLYYKLCSIREKISFSEEQKKNIAQNYKLKTPQLRVLFMHLNEISLLDQFMEVELDTFKASEYHIQPLDVIHPFKTILPTVYKQLSGSLEFPFSNLNQKDFNLDSSPQESKKNLSTPKRNKQLQAMKKLDSDQNTFQNRLHGETREIKLHQSLRDISVNNKMTIDGESKSYLKRTVSQAIQPQGAVRRKRRNISNITPHTNPNMSGFEIPESTL